VWEDIGALSFCRRSLEPALRSARHARRLRSLAVVIERPLFRRFRKSADAYPQLAQTNGAPRKARPDHGDESQPRFACQLGPQKRNCNIAGSHRTSAPLPS
jgi:hypothetical protein